jgi:hypothetical protein
MIRTTAVLLLALGLAIAPAAAFASIRVPSKIDYASGATVRPEVRAQCDLQALIPAAVADASSNIELVSSGANVRLEITAVHAPGGWVFSGPKWVQVSGSMGGKSFRAKRYSAFDPFAGGTCGILGKIARVLGRDIAAWLENPTDNAEIGDAQ